jgi:hypothetical protein
MVAPDLDWLSNASKFETALCWTKRDLYADSSMWWSYNNVKIGTGTDARRSGSL